MFDFGSPWFHYELFPVLVTECPGCSKPFRLSSGVICGEFEENRSLYLAYIPPPGKHKQVVKVLIRLGQINDDSPPAKFTETHEVWVENGKVQVATIKNGKRKIREVVPSYISDEDGYDLIDFIVQADKHIGPFLNISGAKRSRKSG